MSQEDESTQAKIAALAADLRDPPYPLRDPVTGYALGGLTGNPTTRKVSMPANTHDLPLADRAFTLNVESGPSFSSGAGVFSRAEGTKCGGSQFTYRGPPNLQQIPKAGMGEFFTLEETQNLPPGTLFLAFNPDTAKDTLEKFKAACEQMERLVQSVRNQLALNICPVRRHAGNQAERYKHLFTPTGRHTETRDEQYRRLLAISQEQINSLRVPILCKPAPNSPVITAGYMMRSMAERIAREIQEDQDRFTMAGLRKGKPKPNTGPIGRKERWRK